MYTYHCKNLFILMQSSSQNNYFSEVIDNHYSYIEPYNSSDEIPPHF